MGVTHKLKQEVISFIIDQKRGNPKLGCREIAEITSDKFLIKISKSSVNSIIKNSNLSNSVGRPNKILDDKNKKFQIPSEKKQQISKELHKIPLPIIKNSKNEEISELSNKKSLKLEPDNSPKIIVETEKILKNPEKLNLSLNSSETKKMTNSANTININFKFAGLIFLKLVFWENMGEEFLGNLLQSYNSGIDKNLFDKKCNVSFIYAILDIYQRNSDIDSVLTFMDNIENVDIDLDLINKEIPKEDKLKLLTKVDLELQQLLNQSKMVTLKLKNNKIINLNAGITHLVYSEDVVNIRLPLRILLDNLSNFIISNNRPLLLFNPIKEGMLTTSILDLISSFECVEGYKIEEISVMGDNDNLLAEFTTIPQIHRRYAFGMLATNTECDYITKSAQWAAKEKVILENSKEPIWYTITKTDFFNRKIDGLIGELNVISIWEEEKAEPKVVIITNLEKNHKELIVQYLEKFYYLENYDYKKNMSNQYEGFMNYNHLKINKLKELFLLINKFISYYVFKNYFQIENTEDCANSLLSNIYETRGVLSLLNSYVNIKLDINESDIHYKIVKNAINIVNQRNIRDYLGRYIKITI